MPSGYPDELQLSMGLGNSPQLSMSTKCKTKHTCRHREGTRKQVQEGARASTTRARRHAVSAKTNSPANAQMRSRYAQAGEKYAHTGRAPDVLLSLSLGISGRQRNATHNNGGKWPERVHCCEQRNVLRRVYASQKDGCARVCSALGSALSQARPRSPQHRKTMTVPHL